MSDKEKSLIKYLKEKIEDESKLIQGRVSGDYYQGRIDAFQSVLNYLEPIE